VVALQTFSSALETNAKADADLKIMSRLGGEDDRVKVLHFRERFEKESAPLSNYRVAEIESYNASA
jgi:hypothetical protein